MTNEEAKEFLDNLKICISEHPIVADWLVEIVDRKTEPTGYNLLPVDKDINVRSKTEPKTYCDNCMYLHCNYECAGEIVHKMIDDAVIAEDDYPDLKQRMHDAVDEYEPQTEMTTEQVVSELLSMKKILDDGKMPKQRCGNCKHLTYRWNKTWCDIKCDNPHDMVCDKWERSE